MESMLVSDAQLITEAKGGNLTSFEVLLKRYEKRLHSFAYKKLLDSDAANDVVQETFIRVFKTLQKFDTTKPFTSWMYTIAKNLCFDILRKGRHSAVLEWDIPDTNESFLSRIIRAEAVTAVWDAIKILPEKYKLPLIGFYFSNLSLRELSYNLNMSENTVKTRLRRAKGYLKVELGRKGYG
jgi:RNA polymerase sigma-70 factor, ECF subfamily